MPAGTMEPDWIKLLEELGELAKRLAHDVPTALSHEGLSLTVAQDLWDAIEAVLDQAERLQVLMEDRDAPEGTRAPVEIIHDILLELQAATSERIIALGGPSPSPAPSVG